jgi:indole-3-glycerol phosphate synthase
MEKLPPEMIQAVPDVLARIVDHKRIELAGSLPRRAELERLAADSVARRLDFRAALTDRRPAIIAEIKQASPSKGVLTAGFDPAAMAGVYRAGGAAALSVLTDARFFRGSLEDLEAARKVSGLPALRKDFTIDEFHVIEAAAHGADAILLIAAILPPSRLREYRELAAFFRMAALVEVHDAAELEAALDSGAEVVGVNNRNLHDFSVTIETSLRLAERIPQHLLKVSESGIRSPSEVSRLLDAGYHAFLIGEHLMKSADPAAALRALASAPAQLSR